MYVIVILWYLKKQLNENCNDFMSTFYRLLKYKAVPAPISRKASKRAACFCVKNV